MVVLGFDTATPATVVGLRLADGSTLEAHDDPPPPGERPGHATRLLPLADGLLAQAGLGWEALERIAVGVGPGTFTGLRIGVATARGLAQALSVALVGVSTPQALAEGAWTSAPGEWDAVLAVVDARRGEAFAGAYGPGRELVSPRALAPHALDSVLALADASAGGARWLAVGDGAVRFREHLHELEVEVAEASSPLHRVSGAAICDLALGLPPLGFQAVLPDYLRRPDAEIALEGAAR